MKVACTRSCRLLLLATQVAVTASVAAWYLLPAPPDVVRPVYVEYRGHGQSLSVIDSLQEITSAADFERTVGKLDSIRPAIDFDREKLVRVQWADHGPLNARLDVRTRWLGTTAEFFVTKPSSNYATFSEQLNQDWYAVPGTWQVALVSSRSIALSDAAILAFAIVQVGLAVFILAGGTGPAGRPIVPSIQAPGVQSIPAATS